MTSRNKLPRARKRALLRVFGERCETYDKNCPSCIAHRMWEEIEKLRKEKMYVQNENSYLRTFQKKYRAACEENSKIAKLVTGTLKH